MVKQSKILENLPEMLRILRRENKQWKVPVVGTFAHGENASFKILISTMLSLRTKDHVTEKASHRLFDMAGTPHEMLKLSVPEIEKAIYPAGFYRTKARNIHKVCQILIEKFEGKVPDDIDVLLTLPGVGRKTANLVATIGYGKHGICVDTHVHRICNRWGLVKTKTPEETEHALRKILPKRYWITFNDILVTFGQNWCQPVSPFCKNCKIRSYCPRIGVKHSR